MFAVLRKRNFALLWLGQFVSLSGDGLLIIALPFYVYQLTGSILQTGISVMVEMLPRVLLGSVAGVFADRWNRRATMIVTDLLRAAVLLLLLLVHSANLLWLIYVVMATQAIITQFFTPASMAIIPSLVEVEQLVPANSLSSLSRAATRIIGPPLGGALFAALGLTSVVLADSASYVFSMLMILLISLPASAKDEAPVRTEQKERVSIAVKRVWEEWVAGLRLIGRDQALVGVFLTWGTLMLANGVLYVMLVIFVKNVMQGDSTVLGWMVAAQGVGSMVGAILAGAINKALRPVYQIALCMLSAGVAILVITYDPQLILSLVLFALVGIFVVGCVVSIQTLMQVSVDDRYRGRVFGASETVMGLTMLIGLAVSSGFGDSLGVVMWMSISGVLMLIAGLIALLTLRHARLPQVDMTEKKEAVLEEATLP
jgi:MFS family permease